ncbi:hypothetical protein GCM10022224_094900 [Nonomuraea antimicrobica]|uniref:Uncharacterized protein n=1 Tax=Nonomuraea antimicrobica TaxID=561173 RepID=A0ABP7E4L7_9ACTN
MTTPRGSPDSRPHTKSLCQQALKLVVVDGLHDHHRPWQPAGAGERPVTRAAHTLKAPAMNLQVPAVATARLNHNPGSRIDR